MLKVRFEDSITAWMLSFKGVLSMPVLIVHCVSYIRENDITLEQLKESRLRYCQLRGLEYDRIKGFIKERESGN